MDVPAERPTRTAGPNLHPAARHAAGSRRRRPTGEPPPLPHHLQTSGVRWLVATLVLIVLAVVVFARGLQGLAVGVAVEVATNSLRHGGGRGTLRVWREDGALVCEVRDAGRLQNPMAGRERPTPERDGGRGLWMVNQLCDLVQLRSFPDGAAVRVHVYLP